MEKNVIFEMADKLKSLQEEKKELEARAKELGSQIEELDLQLSDAMTEAELDRFSRNGCTFYLKSRLFASPVSGMKEMLGEHDEYGVVTESSEEALYEGIRRLLDQPELLAHYKRQAELRGKDFSTQNTVCAVESLMKELMGGLQ